MIHPQTEIRKISDQIGYGVFAKEFIPLGTLVYVLDPLEIRLSPEEYRALLPQLAEEVERYSYIDPQGYRVVSWDLGKYVNHSCSANTLSTPYGFEIAIRDIEAGEEITDEYSLFNLESSLICGCGSPECRGLISSDDPLRLAPDWDQKIGEALNHIWKVPQPLWDLLSLDTLNQLQDLQQGKQTCPSVSTLLIPVVKKA